MVGASGKVGAEGICRRGGLLTVYGIIISSPRNAKFALDAIQTSKLVGISCVKKMILHNARFPIVKDVKTQRKSSPQGVDRNEAEYGDHRGKPPP
jgi:hypothetical protein